MMAVAAVLVTLGVVLLTFWYFMSIWRRPESRRHPPGPIPLPMVGNALSFILHGSGHFSHKLLEWQKSYGPIFTVYLGPSPWVVVCGYESIREVFATSNSAGVTSRPMSIGPHLEEGAGLGLTFTPDWKEQRKFALSILRDFSLGRELENKVNAEANELVHHLARLDGHPLDLTELLRASVANIIGAVIFGKRFELDDGDFATIVRSLRNADLASNLGAILSSYVPFITYLPGDPLGLKRNQRYAKEMLDVIRQKVAEHKELLETEPNQGMNLEDLADSIRETRDCPKDYVDHYLLKIQKNREEGVHSSFTEENLVVSTKDLFSAGTNTTSTTLQWAFLLAAKHQDFQDKVRQEILETVGTDRSPSLNDQPNMPVTNAAITELLRMNHVSPSTLPYLTDCDVTVKDVLIPKGSYLVGHLYSATHDDSFFNHPHVFQPERFLDPENSDRAQHVIPFGTGRRMCPGERLARMELFIFYTQILQKFKVEFGEETSSIAEAIDRPVDHTLMFKPLSVNLNEE